MNERSEGRTLESDSVDALANRVCDNTISPEERAQLELLLTSSSDHRRRYLRYLMVNAQLVWRYRTGGPGHGKESPEVSPPQRSINGPTRRFGRGPRGWLVGVLAVCAGVSAIAIGAGWLLSQPGASAVVADRMGADRGSAEQAGAEKGGARVASTFVATIVESSGVLLYADRSPLEVGARVAAGDLLLDGGNAEFVFDSGARLVVEGPAELSICDAGAAFLRTGTAVVFVPERAVGFQLATPTSLLIDQGTEFGVVAEASGATEVHVFKGQVDVLAAENAQADGRNDTRQSGDRVAVLDRQARRVEASGTTGKDVAFDPAQFGELKSRVGEPIQWPVINGGNDHYYQIVVHDQPMTWQGAALDAFRRHHRGQPGHLVSVTSEAEHRFIVDRLLNDTPQTRAWIGLTDVLREGHFRWITAEPVDFEQWLAKPIQQPDNFKERPEHGGEDYGMYTKFPGGDWGWNDLSNDSIYETVSMSIVEFEPQLDSLKQRSMAFEPIEWRQDAGGNGNFYRLVLSLEPLKWNAVSERAAQTSLNGASGALVSLETPAEAEFVRLHVLRVCGIPANMIGFCGRLDQEQDPRWASGAPVDRSFFSGRPLVGQAGYGELRWINNRWRAQVVGEDVVPSGWFGYLIEYPNQAEAEAGDVPPTDSKGVLSAAGAT